MRKPSTTVTETDTRCRPRTRRSTIDPYCVESTTWTRDELLRARGIDPHPRPRRRPATRPR